MSACEDALKASWNIFITRWNQIDMRAEIERHERRRQDHSLVELRDQLCMACDSERRLFFVDVVEGCWCTKGSGRGRPPMSTWEKDTAERVLSQGALVDIQATHSRTRGREYRTIGEHVAPTCLTLEGNPTSGRDNDGSTWSETFRPNDREVYPRYNMVNHRSPLMGVEEFERSQNSMVLNHIAPSDVGSLPADVGFWQVTTCSEPIRVMAKIRSFDLRCDDSEQWLDQYRNIVDDLEPRVASLEARHSAMEAMLASMTQSHDAICAQFRQFCSESGMELEPPKKKYKGSHYEPYPAGTKRPYPLEGSTGIDPSPSNNVCIYQ
uniref:AlNc14C30G2846 protein n=1 Tax=Albugo laibachii Nc14 TaxID=890382 RepID=F0W7P2_9STRA|nr:AlNc14C30G2846 [Albugo laibachii Nc14]|eukprot:CCA17143.1 AlNc14C30G2846 [Albugo laibachii Nc14]